MVRNESLKDASWGTGLTIAGIQLQENAQIH